MSGAWEDRFRAPRWSVPEWARDAPERSVLSGNATGTWELYTWSGTGPPTQATSRPQGTQAGALDPAGDALWWFADTDGDEFGVWHRQPFGTPPGSAEPALPGIPAAYTAGLALGRSGTAVVGTSDDDGSRVYLVPPGGPPQLLYSHAEDASVADLSRDERLILLSHSEHGDARRPALRVLDRDGTTVGDLWDGPGKGLSAVAFAPTGEVVVLAVHERHGRSEPLLWWPADGRVQEIRVDLPGELSADWFPDATALLVLAEHRARTTAHRLALDSGRLELVSPEGGTVSEASTRPDRSVWAAWSTAADPPAVVVLPGGGQLLAPPPGPEAPASVPVRDVDAPGPGGPVHALLSLPRAGATPHPTVFVVHGGPTWHDTDSFGPGIAAWVDHGYAVVQVNYRGSTGYGSAWRDALEAAPGRVELADVAAVREALVAEGTVDAARCVLAGGSWGGFLTLLGLGTQPELWACGVAAVPVADYLAAYDDEMEGLKAFDRSLFGGPPTEVPERYREASPLTYAAAVRAPLLVLAGENDPRCPIRQVDNYLAALAARGAPHEVYRFDAGHGSLVMEERIRQMRVELDFVRRHVPPD
ncbi:MAG: S9 family peptidase [Mycobacteriales bacterium]